MSFSIQRFTRFHSFKFIYWCKTKLKFKSYGLDSSDDVSNIILSTLGRSGSKYFRLNLDYNNILMFKRWNHFYPYEINQIVSNESNNVKVIFIFADPVEIVLSVLEREKDVGYEWVLQHYKNLKADINDHKSLLEMDGLRLEKMFDAFYKNQSFDLLTLNFDFIPYNLDVISEFLGEKFILYEKYKKRKLRFNTLNDDTKNIILRTYGNFSKKVSDASKAKIWNKI